MAGPNASFIYNIFDTTNNIDDRKIMVGLLNKYGVVKGKEYWEEYGNTIMKRQFDTSMLDGLLASYNEIYIRLNSTPTDVDISTSSASNANVNEWNVVDMLINSGKLKLDPLICPDVEVGTLQIVGDKFINVDEEVDVGVPYTEYDVPFTANSYKGIHFNNISVVLFKIQETSGIANFDPAVPLTPTSLASAYIAFLNGMELPDLDIYGYHIGRGIINTDSLKGLLDDILYNINDEITEKDEEYVELLAQLIESLSTPFDYVVTLPHTKITEITLPNFNIKNVYDIALFRWGIIFQEGMLANKLVDGQFDDDILYNGTLTDKYILNSRGELVFRNTLTYKPSPLDPPVEVHIMRTTYTKLASPIDCIALSSPYNIPMSLPNIGESLA